VIAVAVISLIVSAPPPTGFTTAVERVALERTAAKAEARVDPLTRTIVLIGARPTPKRKSQLCPTAQTRRSDVVLTCTTRRLWATVGEDAQGLFLDVRTLRGVTWTWDANAVPLQPWPLKPLGIPDTCPGTTDAVKAECLLAEGRLFEAEELYSSALRGVDAHLARVRLGDLAMLRGDAETALGWYSKVTSAGPTARMAELRLCDLTGSCLGQKPPTLAGLPPEMELEARLHLIRQDLAIDRDRQAMEQLVSQLEAKRPICQRTRGFCQKAVAAALASDDDETVSLALSAFASAGLAEGPFGVEVSQAAAAAAEAAGAPAFAASVLSSLSGRLPADELDRHLQHVARLFLAARDVVRAGTIVEYASQKLAPSAFRTRAWASLQRAATVERARPGPSAKASPTLAARLPDLTADVELSRELARAAQVRSAAASPPPTPSSSSPEKP
jgi:tetratricopeptide (TPR) repeat protein